MKSFMNLVLIAILAFSVSTMPLFLSPIDFSTSIETEDQGFESISIQFNTRSNAHVVNPDIIQLELSTNKSITLNASSDELFLVDIYQDDQLVVSDHPVSITPTLILDEGTYTLAPDAPLAVSVDISQQALELKNGLYQMVFKSAFNELMDQTVPIHATYTRDGYYVAASDASPENLVGIPYYLATNSNQLIPVTEFVRWTDSLHRLMTAAYRDESPIENLKIPVGGINYIISRDGAIYIDLPREDSIYQGDDIVSENAFWAFVRPFSELPGILQVRFTIDNHVVETFFNDQNIRFAIPYSKENLVYLPVQAGERYFLSESILLLSDEELGLEAQISEMMAMIQQHIYISFSYEIVDADFYLNIGEPFVEESSDKIDMLIESVLYSVSTLDGIETIVLRPEDPSIEQLGSYPTQIPIQPRPYMNPIIEESP